MARYFIKARAIKYIKEYEFLLFEKKLANKHWKNNGTKPGLDAGKTASKTVIHKKELIRDEFIQLNNSVISKLVVRKWIEVTDLSDSPNSLNQNIRFKTPVLRPDLCNYSDAYFC